jgi:hypothetical protein
LWSDCRVFTEITTWREQERRSPLWAIENFLLVETECFNIVSSASSVVKCGVLVWPSADVIA